MKSLPEILALPRYWKGHIPENYLPAAVFARRAGSSVSHVKKSFVAGAISSEHCVASPIKSDPNNVRLYIDWNAAAIDYIAGRDPTTWPADFIPDGNPYKPITPTRDFGPRVDAPTDEDIEQLDVTAILNGPLPVTANDAKVQKEQLIILEKRAQIKLANNETIRMAEVKAIMKEVAYQFRAALKSAARQMAPDQAACTDVARCVTIAEQHLDKALKKLKPFDTGIFKRQKGRR